MANNSAVIERQRGQRSEHAPRNEEGNIVEPPGVVESTDTVENEELENEATTPRSDVKVTFEEADKLISGKAQLTGESSIITGATVQRHGIVEQRKGIARLDESGEMINQTELWRCQCGVKFQGKDVEATRKLALRHLQKFDPEVPRGLE